MIFAIFFAPTNGNVLEFPHFSFRTKEAAKNGLNLTYGGLLLSLQNCVPEATKVGPWQLHRFVLFGNSPNSHSASPSPR